MSASSSSKVQKAARALRDRYGEINGWPRNRCKIITGAILTRWERVTRALATLTSRGLSRFPPLQGVSTTLRRLYDVQVFSGIKALRSQSLAAPGMDTYGSEVMENIPAAVQRADLPLLNGMYRETADSILCSGFSCTGFVIDAYREKILRWTGIHTPRSAAKALSEGVLSCNSKVERQTHAHIMEYQKEFCKKEV